MMWKGRGKRERWGELEPISVLDLGEVSTHGCI